MSDLFITAFFLYCYCGNYAYIHSVIDNHARYVLCLYVSCLQCFDAVGRKGMQFVKTEWWDAGMVLCLDQGADLHMAQLMPLPFTVSCFSKSRLVLPFWCQLTHVVLDRIQEGHKTVVGMCVCFVCYIC